MADKKNIVVTGGSGFLGSFLCEKLLEAGDAHVICVDNFVTSQESNIDHLLKNADFEFINQDINKTFDLDNFSELARFKVKFLGVQEIYHLACPNSGKKFESIKMETLLTNSTGMKNILDMAVKYKAKMLHTSSVVVYGPRPVDNAPYTETDFGSVDAVSPRSCYDEGKRFTETMCATYADVHALDIKIARISRTYGPRLALFDGQMIPDFITNALDNKDLVIYGDETFSTSLIYVADIIDGIMKLMKAPRDIGPVNFGSDIDVPLVDVARRVIEMTGSTSHITFQEPLLFITQLGLLDITKAREKLNWLPLVRLDEGLKRSIDYTIANKTLLGFNFGDLKGRLGA